MGCGFCALPRSKLLRQPGAWQAHCPRWALHLVHLPDPGGSVSWVCHEGTVPDVPCVSSGELISGCDTPGRCDPSRIPSQEDVIINSQPAHSLVEDAVSGAEFAGAPCLPSLTVVHLPLCLWGRRALNGSWLALPWYSLGHAQSFILWMRQESPCCVRVFHRKGPFFVCVSGDLTVWIAMAQESYRLSSGHSKVVLMLRTNDAAHTSLFRPHLLLVDASI